MAQNGLIKQPTKCPKMGNTSQNNRPTKWSNKYTLAQCQWTNDQQSTGENKKGNGLERHKQPATCQKCGMNLENEARTADQRSTNTG